MASRASRPLGRPRSERARQAILRAALELARERGAGALTMDAVVRRAAVSKETVYRWWPSKTHVLLEALAEFGERAIPIPDTGSLGGDLRAFMRATARALDPPTQRVLRTLAAEAATEKSLAAKVRDQFLARRRAALGTVFQQAVSRGELSPERAHIDLDLVFGSLWYRLIFDLGPLDRNWADAVSGAIAAQHAPRS